MVPAHAVMNESGCRCRGGDGIEERLFNSKCLSRRE